MDYAKVVLLLFLASIVNFGSADDVTPPIIASCPGNITQYVGLGSTGANIYWTEPIATDDSGFTPTRTSTHEPSYFFSTGATQVTYTFIDRAGNSTTCIFTVSVNEAEVYFRSVERRQTSNQTEAEGDSQHVALGQKLEQFNNNLSALYINGADSDSFRELYTDGAMKLFFGRPPLWAEGAAEESAEFLARFKSKFGVLAHYELTVVDYGELDGGMVWATGNGYGYDSDNADATPKSSMTYERVWEYDDNGNLLLAINAFFVNHF